MSKTKQIETQYGGIELETVDCASCGNEHPKEESKQFYIGAVKDTDKWTHNNTYEVEFDLNDYKSGWVCEYCRDDPAAYPSGTIFDVVASTKALVTALAILAVVVIFFS